MSNLKRLWDTENKMTVWAVDKSNPKKAYQVWTNDDGSHLYIFTKNGWVELDQTKEDVKEYGHVWTELDDEMVGYYLTSNPTELYNWDEGDEVSYTFKDWDGTVLKTGKVDEGTAPTPPANPTREATAQYTYTFAGWNPEVGAISKRTTYTATYTATVNQYTVTISSNDTDYGTVDESTVTVDYGTAISVNGNVLTIGDTEVTATANTDYQFSTWMEGRSGDPLPATVNGALSVMAVFELAPVTITFSSNSCIDALTEEPIVGGQTLTFSKNSVTVIPGETKSRLVYNNPDEGIYLTSIEFLGDDGETVIDTVNIIYPTQTGYYFTAIEALITTDVTFDENGYITSGGNLDLTTTRFEEVSITVQSNDTSKGTVDIPSITGLVGFQIDELNNTIKTFDTTVGDFVTVTATPIDGAAFKEWQGLPELGIEGPFTITAVFEAGR